MWLSVFIFFWIIGIVKVVCWGGLSVIFVLVFCLWIISLFFVRFCRV